jgi:hypothetical protein
MKSADISTVIVNGRVLLDDRKLTIADEPGIIQKAVAWGKKIRA